jgi:hypothetical protein
MKDIPADHFMNLSDRPRVAATMARAVRLVYNARIYTATMSLIASYVDALAGGDKDKCVKFLEEQFPELCSELKTAEKSGGLVFYEKFRSGMVHLNSPKLGFALLEEHEADGKYVADVRVGGMEMRGINVDRLVKEFIKLADTIAGDSKPEGV